MNKRIKRTAVSRWMAMTAAALTLGACSQDETAGGDGALSPMELTATGLESMVTPMTRATVDGNWEGVDEVAVKVGSEVKEYTVAPDGAATGAQALLTSTDPFYWPASGDVTVSAWWPYNVGDITTKPAVAVKSDQSGVGYAASDFIEAVDQRVTEGYRKLVFEHRTAKICVTLKAADGTTPLTGAVVSIVVGGQTVVEKCYNGDSSNGYLALIAPTAAEEELTVKITADSKNYVYKHTTAVKYEANCQYTFNLKLKGDEVVALSGCTITGWTDKTLVSDGTAEEVGYTVDASGAYHVTSAAGLDAWAAAVASSFDKRVSCVLENDIKMPALQDGETSNWEPISTFFGIFDGNGKTITGLVVNKGTESEAGFIAWNNGTVKNLTLENAKITGGNTVGAVVCDNHGTIENCHVTGTSVITGGSGNLVGGVAGTNNPNSTILACHVAKGCKVSGSSQVGGIVGYNNDNITGCYALCSLTGNNTGGICGQVNGGSLTACYSKCSYSLGYNIGGIVGNIPDASITATYAACYWQGDTNCGSGVGSAMTDPSGMTKIEGETSWATACGEMNNNLTGYEYYANTTGTSADEPLMLRKKQ